MIMSYDDPLFHFFNTNLLEEFFRDVPANRLVGDSFPPMDSYRLEDKSGVVELALAGYKAEQLKVEYDGSSIVISAEKGDTSTPNRRIAKRAFKQALHVPRDLDGSNLKVSFVDGILRIEIPVNEEAKPKCFKIQTEQKVLGK